MLETVAAAGGALTRGRARRLPHGVVQASAVLADIAGSAAAVILALDSRFGGTDTRIQGLTAYRYSTAIVALPLVWISVIALRGGYRSRTMGSHTGEEIRQVAVGTVALLSVFGVVSLTLHVDLSRSFVLTTLVLLPLFVLASRFLMQRFVGLFLGGGWTLHYAAVYGSPALVDLFVRHVERNVKSGLSIVGTFHDEAIVGDSDSASKVVTLAKSVDADTVIIVGSHLFSAGDLQRLAWALEGTQIQLVVAPAMLHFAGPRIFVRTIEGLPLLGVEAPTFSGVRRLAKDAIDMCAAVVLLALASPFILGICCAVWVEDRAWPFYLQTRVGKNGRLFRMVKFRTMHPGAESIVPNLRALNQAKGPLFKIRRDPRVTRVGRWLRRYSLDELPQLINVVKGEMSLVGPRPPLPAEVETYDADVRRRLLVKPGITGLWQVSGRANLDWDESVRLDLYYVENWSLSLDMVLLGKTVGAVLTARGAY